MIVENKGYQVEEVKKHSEYMTTYKLKDNNNVSYRLFVEDYREADFMYEKYHKAVINEVGKGQLKTVNVNEIICGRQEK